jgi:hypothetical protein
LHEDDADVHHYEKGSYETVANDGRIAGAPGPFRRETRALAQGSEAFRGRSARSKRPQGSIGDLTFGTKQRNESIYNKSESRMFENTVRVRRLVEQMEKKEAEKDET